MLFRAMYSDLSILMRISPPSVYACMSLSQASLSLHSFRIVERADHCAVVSSTVILLFFFAIVYCKLSVI